MIKTRLNDGHCYNIDFVTKPLVRADKDEEFLEKVNQSLDSEYVSKIEQADLRSRLDNFHSLFAGATHLPVGTQHIYVTRVNKDKLRKVVQASYKQLLQESLKLGNSDL